jgi:carboxymethylenebutenolidase
LQRRNAPVSAARNGTFVISASLTAGIALKAQVEALPAPGVLQDIQATIDHAGKTLGPVSKVGLVGYCWGGLLSWRVACLL